MKTENLKLQTETLLFPTLIILFGVLLRLVPHMPNFAPITAIALFGGMYLSKKYALIVPLVIMVISDYFLGFHDTILFVYVSFFISGLLGLWVRRDKNALRILTVTLLSSVIFFLITNFGVWFMGNMYQRTTNGLITAYVMAIPFFRNTIMGDLLYTTTFILMYEFMRYFLQRRSIVISRRKK